MTLKDIIKLLKDNKNLTDMLADGQNSIYHLKSPTRGSYPIIIITLISDVPHQIADNVEIAKKQVYRIHILSENGQYEEIYKELIQTLAFPQIQRKSTYEFVDNDDIFYKVIDFTIIN